MTSFEVLDPVMPESLKSLTFLVKKEKNDQLRGSSCVRMLRGPWCGPMPVSGSSRHLQLNSRVVASDSNSKEHQSALSSTGGSAALAPNGRSFFEGL